MKVVKHMNSLSQSKQTLRLSTIVQQVHSEDMVRRGTLQLGSSQIEFNGEGVGGRGATEPNKAASRRKLLMKMQEDFPPEETATRRLEKELGGILAQGSADDLCSCQREWTSFDYNRTECGYSKYMGFIDTATFLDSPYQDYEKIAVPLCRPDVSKSCSSMVNEGSSRQSRKTVETEPSLGTKRISTNIKMRPSGKNDDLDNRLRNRTSIRSRITNPESAGSKGLPSFGKSATQLEETRGLLKSYVNNEEITLMRHRTKRRLSALELSKSKSNLRST